MNQYIHRHRTQFSYPMQYAVLVIIIFCIHFFRDPRVYLYPPLQAEDGSAIFAFFYNHRAFSMLFRYKGGYLPLFPNLIGWTAVRFPVIWVPYLLTWIPFGGTLVAHSLFFSRCFRHILPSDALRFWGCVAIAANPFGQHHLIAHTDYSIWNWLLIFIWIGLLRLPRRGTLRYMILYHILIWGHPLTGIVFPVTLYFFLTTDDQGHRWLYLGCLTHLIFHQVVGSSGADFVQFKQAFLALNLPKELDQLTEAHWPLLIRFGWHSVIILFTNIGYLFYYIADYVILRTLIGEWGFAWMAQQHLLLLGCVLGLVCLAGCIWRAYVIRNRCLLVLAIYFMGSLTYLSLCTRGLQLLDLTPNYQVFSPRYLYIPTIFFILLLVSCAVTRRGISRQSVQTDFSSGQEPRRYGILSVEIIVGIFLALNIVPENRTQYHSAHAENGKRVQQFVRQLSQIEKKQGTWRGIRLRLEKLNDWPIEIDTTQP